jgi:hypothetical protein
MPTEYFYTESQAEHDLYGGVGGARNQFTLGAGANKNIATQIGGGRAGPPTHDDDTSYIVHPYSLGNAWQQVNISWPSPLEKWLGVLTLAHRTRVDLATGAGNGWRTIRFAYTGGTNNWWYSSPTNIAAVNNASATYVTSALVDVSDATLCRPLRGAEDTQTVWHASDFRNGNNNRLCCIVYGHSEETTYERDIWWTSIFGEISFYPYPNDGWLFLLGLLPFTLTGIEQFKDLLSWRKTSHPRGTVMHPGETEEAWRAYKEYRRPAYAY